MTRINDEAERVRRWAVDLGATGAVIEGKGDMRWVKLLRGSDAAYVRVVASRYAPLGPAALTGETRIVADIGVGNLRYPGRPTSAIEALDAVGGWLGADADDLDALRLSFARRSSAAKRAAETQQGRIEVLRRHVPGQIARRVMAKPALADEIIRAATHRRRGLPFDEVAAEVASLVVQKMSVQNLVEGGFAPAFRSRLMNLCADASVERVLKVVSGTPYAAEVQGLVYDDLLSMPVGLRVHQAEIEARVRNSDIRGGRTLRDTDAAVTRVVVATARRVRVERRDVLALFALRAATAADVQGAWAVVSNAQKTLLAIPECPVPAAVCEPYRNESAIWEDLLAMDEDTSVFLPAAALGNGGERS